MTGPPRYFIRTYGCQMNVHDSRRIEEVLHRDGYVPSLTPETADLIVVNTCSVREKAEHKLMSLLGRLRPQADRAVLAVAGCVAQQEGQRLVEKAPFLQVVVGPDNIAELPELVRRARGGETTIKTVHDLERPAFLTAQSRGDEVTSFVTVMKGCDERCTFCIVPTTRGPERYRSADDIVAEIAQMVAGGTREVTLLGQTVNSWYEQGPTSRSKTAPSGSEFAELLRRIDREVPELARLRYTSPHPRHLTDALIAAHRDLVLLPAHVHLPVQSGSGRVLRRMARRYTPEHYIERARALMAAREGLTMSTDFIVGFPGETEDDFQQTLELVREVGFVAAFCFKYSPRPNTPALALGDDVSREVKDERLQRLFAAVSEQQQLHLQRLVGTRAQVLVEGPNDASMNRFSGRSERHEIVHLEAPPGIDPTGRLVDVTIMEANQHSLVGCMDGAELPAMPVPRSKRKLPVVAR